MFNPLFTVATLLLLAATPGACDTTDLTTPEAAKELASKLEAAKAAGTLEEKVAHYQALTDVVESLGKGIGLGDTCVAHHVYMGGAMGVNKTAGLSNQWSTNAIKPANYSEPVIAGLLAVAKADVYALKQMVETSTKVLAGLALLQADDAAAKAINATVTALTPEQKTTYKTEIAAMQTTIATALKDNVKNAISTLAPVEEVIYALAQGNTATNGLLKTDSADTNAATKLNTDAATLAKDTSAMIEGYFAVLKTVGVTDGKELTTLKKQKTVATTGASKADFGEVDDLDGKAFFTLADAYQKAFVKYVGTIVGTKTTLAELKLIANANAVVGQVAATTADSDNKTDGEALKTAREAYVAAINETTKENATVASIIMCGRLSLTDIIPGIAST